MTTNRITDEKTADPHQALMAMGDEAFSHKAYDKAKTAYDALASALPHNYRILCRRVVASLAKNPSDEETSLNEIKEFLAQQPKPPLKIDRHTQLLHTQLLLEIKLDKKDDVKNTSTILEKTNPHYRFAQVCLEETPLSMMYHILALETHTWREIYVNLNTPAYQINRAANIIQLSNAPKEDILAAKETLNKFKSTHTAAHYQHAYFLLQNDKDSSEFKTGEETLLQLAAQGVPYAQSVLAVKYAHLFGAEHPKTKKWSYEAQKNNEPTTLLQCADKLIQLDAKAHYHRITHYLCIVNNWEIYGQQALASFQTLDEHLLRYADQLFFTRRYREAINEYHGYRENDIPFFNNKKIAAVAMLAAHLKQQEDQRFIMSSFWVVEFTRRLIEELTQEEQQPALAKQASALKCALHETWYMLENQFGNQIEATRILQELHGKRLFQRKSTLTNQAASTPLLLALSAIDSEHMESWIDLINRFEEKQTCLNDLIAHFGEGTRHRKIASTLLAKYHQKKSNDDKVAHSSDKTKKSNAMAIPTKTPDVKADKKFVPPQTTAKNRKDIGFERLLMSPEEDVTPTAAHADTKKGMPSPNPSTSRMALPSIDTLPITSTVFAGKGAREKERIKIFMQKQQEKHAELDDPQKNKKHFGMQQQFTEEAARGEQAEKMALAAQQTAQKVKKQPPVTASTTASITIALQEQPPTLTISATAQLTMSQQPQPLSMPMMFPAQPQLFLAPILTADGRPVFIWDFPQQFYANPNLMYHPALAQQQPVYPQQITIIQQPSYYPH